MIAHVNEVRAAIIVHGEIPLFFYVLADQSGRPGPGVDSPKGLLRERKQPAELV